ncbi:MAG: DUF4159 domain-containing protein, partial [Chloroflexi bacterium]|nr:DUF4159 domain-containing protein [Chloroflexota bacterium]
DRFFTLSGSERAALRRYVYEDGGTIYGEDCHSPDGTNARGGFDAPFRQYMAQIFGKPLQPITLGNMIYHMKFDINEMPSGDRGDRELLEGIHLGGRWAVIYTINDYGDVWSPVHRYYPASLRPPAYRIGTDLYLYALSSYLEFHRTHQPS